MESKAITRQIINTVTDAEQAARSMVASGFFLDAKDQAKAVVKILAGAELGFGPFASMTGVNIIQNKPVLAANLMAAAVKRTGKYNYRIVSHTEDECEIEFLENGAACGRSKFTMHDALLAGLSGKDNWKKYPRNMLFARALSNGQKWYAPDVFNGATVYTPDELGASEDADGNIIEVKAEQTPEQQTAEFIEKKAAEASKPELLCVDGDMITTAEGRVAYQKYQETHNQAAPESVKALKEWWKLNKEAK